MNINKLYKLPTPTGYKGKKPFYSLEDLAKHWELSPEESRSLHDLMQSSSVRLPKIQIVNDQIKNKQKSIISPIWHFFIAKCKIFFYRTKILLLIIENFLKKWLLRKIN